MTVPADSSTPFFLIDGIWLTTAPDRPWKRHRASYVCIENFEGGVMAVQDETGSYSTRVTEGHVFNCLPYPSNGAGSR